MKYNKMFISKIQDNEDTSHKFKHLHVQTILIQQRADTGPTVSY
jgi:hypothetical protein